MSGIAIPLPERRLAAPAAATIRHQPWFIAAALWLAVMPLLLVDLPGFIDLPNNVARAAIAGQLGASPFYDLLFRANPPFIPNAAFDVFYWAVHGLLSPMAVGRVFATLSILITVSGVIALARALGGDLVIAAVVGALLAHDYSLVWGFLNYQLGVGLVLWGATLWLHVRAKPVGRPVGRRGFAARTVGPSILALALYYCHVLPLALLAVVILGIELQAWRRLRLPCRRAVTALLGAGIPFALPAILFLAGSPTAGEFHHVDLPDLLTSLRGCAKALHAGIGLGDYLHLGLLAGLAAMLFALGRVRVAPELRWSLVALTIICLVAPDKTEQAACLQQRLPIVLAFFGVAALRWTPVSTARMHALLYVALVGLGCRTLQLTRAYTARGVATRDANEAMAVVPDQSLLFTLVGPLDRDDAWAKYRAPLVHAACLRALHARVFLPQLLVSKLHHTLAPASETVNDFCQMFALRSSVDTPADVRARACDLRAMSQAAIARGTCPPLPGGVWIAAVHFPADFVFPTDVLEVVTQIEHMHLLRVR